MLGLFLVGEVDLHVVLHVFVAHVFHILALVILLLLTLVLPLHVDVLSITDQDVFVFTIVPLFLSPLVGGLLLEAMVIHVLKIALL